MTTRTQEKNAASKSNGQAANLPAIRGERLPYHPALEERFGIDRSSWRALVEAVFPLAQSIDSVILALSYCKARKLDPFKRVVHIVPIWDSKQGKTVDTIWPGIGELRTTAMRTREYAGRDDAEFGPDITEKVGTENVTYPEWAKVTLYRMVGGERREFAGPKVYWKETYAERGGKTKDKTPNSMWLKRPRGQIEKCAEAAALRAAFPEEIGNDLTNDEVGSLSDMNVIEADQSQKRSRIEALATAFDDEGATDDETNAEVQDAEFSEGEAASEDAGESESEPEPETAAMEVPGENEPAEAFITRMKKELGSLTSPESITALLGRIQNGVGSGVTSQMVAKLKVAANDRVTELESAQKSGGLY